jgi:hypothetical protein
VFADLDSHPYVREQHNESPAESNRWIGVIDTDNTGGALARKLAKAAI